MGAVRIACLVLGALCLVAGPATRTSATSRWIELKSANFLLAGEVDERDLRDVARRLEEFREALSQMLTKSRFDSIPTVVLVFPHQRAFHPFQPLYNGKPIESAGFFQPGPDVNYVTILLNSRVDPYPIVFHEFAHLFINANLGNVPVWFGEGVAEYYSSFRVSSDGKHATVGQAIGRHLMLLRERWVPLEQVFAATHFSPLYNNSRDRNVFYAESWAIVHYLLLGAPARTPQLFRFLELLDTGRPVQQASQEAFGGPPAALDKEARAYVTGRLAFPARLITFPEPVTRKTNAPARPISEAAAEARLGDLLLHMNRHTDADVRLQNALRLEPKQLFAQLSLAELRFRQNRTSDALTMLERAAAEHPDDAAPHLAYGRAVLRRVGPVPTAEEVAPARKALARAVELAPESADALAGMAWALFASREQPEEARRLLERAIQIDPMRPDHVLLLAHVMARQHDFKGARERLGPLMASSRPDVRDRARGVMATVIDYESRVNAQPAAIPASQPGAPAAPPGVETAAPEADRYNFDLRAPRAGEERAFGALQRIECGAGDVVLVVKVGDRVMRLTTAKLDAVDFISHRQDLRGSVMCGMRQPPDPAYITWRPTKRPKFDGEAVAVEFMPKDYVPRPGWPAAVRSPVARPDIPSA